MPCVVLECLCCNACELVIYVRIILVGFKKVPVGF